MPEKVIVIGAGGHGKVVADIVQKSGDILLGFLDDQLADQKFYCGFPILGKIERYMEHLDCSFAIAIGDADVREKIASNLPVKWYIAIHPNAVVSNLDVTIAEGTVIMAGAVVNADARIGKHCIINTGAIVEHDNKIGDFVHISVKACLAGTVRIGNKTWIGIGATVKNNISIAKGCMIGAGAVVVHDIKESGTYVGVPARKIK